MSSGVEQEEEEEDGEAAAASVGMQRVAELLNAGYVASMRRTFMDSAMTELVLVWP